MKVVIDTNALLVTISRSSKHRPIFKALFQAKFEIAVTDEILLEYEEIIGKQSSPEVAKNVVDALVNLPNVIFTKTYFKWDLIESDPDDNKFVDCAVAARVKYVVTNDKHFRILKTINFPNVDIISIDDFLEEVQQLN